MIYLKTDFDMKVFLHDQGTEFWFTGFNEFPYDIPFGIVEANSSNGIMLSTLSVREFDTTILSKKEEPCRFYDDGFELEFINCCKQSIWKNLSDSLGCVIQAQTLYRQTENDFVGTLVQDIRQRMLKAPPLISSNLHVANVGMYFEYI